MFLVRLSPLPDARDKHGLTHLADLVEFVVEGLPCADIHGLVHETGPSLLLTIGVSLVQGFVVVLF